MKSRLFLVLIGIAAFFYTDSLYGQNGLNNKNLSESIFEREPNLGTMQVVQLKLGAGQHLYTGESLSDILDDGYSSLDIRLGWQSKGYADWQKAWNYPLYGIGFYTGWIGERK